MDIKGELTVYFEDTSLYEKYIDHEPTGNKLLRVLEVRMDTGEGRFEMVNELDELMEMTKQYPKHKGLFTVGEELEIRGSWFKIKDISPYGMKLKLLKAKPQYIEDQIEEFAKNMPETRFE